MNSSSRDLQYWLQYDRQHIWHPYSAIGVDLPVFFIQSASGVRLKLADGRELIDGMSSWWSAIHGYNHPVMNSALQNQMQKMAHVMFGGLSHQPAVELASRLIELTPDSLETVFFADSGSVAVEVAMKMAIQYWHASGKPGKQRFVTLRNGYHGDTFGAMSVCDPVTGMHTLFEQAINKQYFADAPTVPFGEQCHESDIASLRTILKNHHSNIAALILEPVVQGAGGMRFYSADYLKQARLLCDEYQVLLIADEIATGFGRTGRLFACEHAEISPDILCLGKALTGGYLTMAATLSSFEIAEKIQSSSPGVFMHGPTFMANPLACAAALASIQLLLDSSWTERITQIADRLEQGLAPCRNYEQVVDVRVLGAIGVVELKQAVDMKSIQSAFVNHGVWVRPFGKLVYLMPPYIINDDDLAALTSAVCSIVGDL
ncbi:MAG: adenosylmethionine--8-amino-7-oxononanoate transaminase [Gammaproteobacteria bacterium]|nr:adenosylmethionine--8-amino-7-oxononanoate transaminase [Gammaproteobacteria bacterium]